MAEEDLVSRIVLAVNEDHRSIHAFSWLRDDPLGLWTPDVQLDIIHVVKEDKDRAKGLDLLKKYNVWATTTYAENLVVKTKLLISKEGPGAGIRDYTKEVTPKLLVMASSNSNSLKHRLVGGVTDYCVRFCACPVLVIKRDRRADIKTNREKIVHVAIAVDTSGPADNAVNWFLNSAVLSNASTLVIVNAVTKPNDKPVARQFLSSYQDRCVASKKEYTMKSGLVYFKGKNIPESIVKYCRDYSVDLLILAAHQHEGLKLTGSCTESIARTTDGDYLIWKSTKNMPKLETKDLTKLNRRSSLDAHLSTGKPKGALRRFSMGADNEQVGTHEDDKPEEVSYVFGDGAQTLSP